MHETIAKENLITRIISSVLLLMMSILKHRFIFLWFQENQYLNCL